MISYEHKKAGCLCEKTLSKRWFLFTTSFSIPPRIKKTSLLPIVKSLNLPNTYFEMTFCMSHADYIYNLLAYQHEVSRFLCHMPNSEIAFMNYLTDNLFRYKHPVYKLFLKDSCWSMKLQSLRFMTDEASQRFFERSASPC
jgi:hypothetical protein